MKRIVPALILAPALLASPSQEQSFVLPNGLRVILLEDHTIPQVRVHLALDFEARGGLATFTGHLLEGAGAGPMSALALAHAIEERGALLQPGWRPGTLEWQLQVGSVELEGALELLAHAVFRPLYDPSQVERLRSRLLRLVQESTPRDAALDSFLGGLGHPEGGRMLSESELRRIPFQELVAFRRRISDPRRAVVVLQGDVSLPLARQVMLQNFGTWTPAPAPVAAADSKVPSSMETSGMSPEAWVGRRIEFASETERAAFDLMAEVFRRRSPQDSIQVQWVRTERRAGLMLAWGQLSLDELLLKLNGMARHGITAEELARAAGALRQQRSMLVLHPRQMVEECLDRHRGVPAAPAAEPTPDQVRGLFDAWLQPAGLRTLVVKSLKTGQ